MSEHELIQRARQGDQAAWERLVRLHQEPAFRLAYLMLGDADAADDVAQETFIRAFRALDRFDASRPLRPWLLRITTNLAYNQRRAVGRYLAVLRRIFADDPHPAPSADAAAGSTWEAQAIWQAIRHLSHADQEIIYLHYFLELSVVETAETLGVAPGTVKSRRHRALERLREIVAREFPGLGEEHPA